MRIILRTNFSITVSNYCTNRNVFESFKNPRRIFDSKKLKEAVDAITEEI